MHAWPFFCQPAQTAKIGEGAFGRCTALQLIDLYEGLTEIGERAFADCAALVIVRFSESLQTIGREANMGCNLQRVVFESRDVAIGADAFFGQPEGHLCVSAKGGPLIETDRKSVV